MVQIIKKISLEVSKPNLIQAIVAKQYDNNSRFLQVTLMHEGKKIEIAPTSTVTINAKRNDGEEKSFAGEANDDGTATVPLTYWMLELEGEVWCDVSVIDTEGRKLTSTKFDLLVERTSCNSGDIADDENYDVLIKLIADVNKVKPDTEMSDTSENPVQNKVIKAYIDDKTRKTEDLFFYNFYNISTNTSGIVITGEGKELSNSTYSTTDYTLLEKGTYYVTGFNKLTEKDIEQKFKYLIRYDLNKSFVSRVDFTSGSFEITTDCYVRFSGTPNNMKFIVISKDYAPTEYVEYGVKLKLEHLPIDTKVSESNNPVSSGAVKEYVDNTIEKIPTSEITVDDEMNDESTNPVQNKVAKAYIDKIANGAEQLMDGKIQEFATELERNIVEVFVVKEQGKGLSSNDFTDEDIARLYDNDWVEIVKETITEPIVRFNIPTNNFQCSFEEMCIEAEIVFTDNTITTQQVKFGKSGTNYWQYNVSAKATGKAYLLLNLKRSIDKKRTYCDGTLSAYYYTLNGASFTSISKETSQNNNIINVNDIDLFWLQTTEANPMAVGTVIKVWGR